MFYEHSLQKTLNESMSIGTWSSWQGFGHSHVNNTWGCLETIFKNRFQFLIKIHFWIVGKGVLRTTMTTKERMFIDGRIHNKRNPCLVGKSLEITIWTPHFSSYVSHSMASSIFIWEIDLLIKNDLESPLIFVLYLKR